MRLEAVVALTVTVAALGCVSDLRWRKIPNWLTFGASGLALVAYLVLSGPSGLVFSLAGWAVGCALFLPFYLLKGMGAGDVKLLAALGSWLGPVKVFWVAIYGALAGGVLALVVLLGAGLLRQAVGNLGLLFTYWRTAGVKPVPGLTLAEASSPKLPYAVPIALGLLVTLWLR